MKDKKYAIGTPAMIEKQKIQDQKRNKFLDTYITDFTLIAFLSLLIISVGGYGILQDQKKSQIRIQAYKAELLKIETRCENQAGRLVLIDKGNQEYLCLKNETIVFSTSKQEIQKNIDPK